MSDDTTESTDAEVIQLSDMVPKRKMGRPPGSKNKKPAVGRRRRPVEKPPGVDGSVETSTEEVLYERQTTNHKHIRRLKCFKEVHEMLVNGISGQTVADFIQMERKEWTGIPRTKAKSRVTAYLGSLREFKADGPLEIRKQRLGSEIDKLEAKKRRLNELDELQDLYWLQRERIDVDVKLEKQVRKLIPTTNAEVRLANEILKNSAQLKVDLGMASAIMNGGNSGESIADKLAKKVTNAAVARVLENPESRLRLTALATKLMGLAGDGRIEKVLESGGLASRVEPPADATRPNTWSDVPTGLEIKDAVFVPVSSASSAPSGVGPLPIVSDGDLEGLEEGEEP